MKVWRFEVIVFSSLISSLCLPAFPPPGVREGEAAEWAEPAEGVHVGAVAEPLLPVAAGAAGGAGHPAAAAASHFLFRHRGLGQHRPHFLSAVALFLLLLLHLRQRGLVPVPVRFWAWRQQQEGEREEQHRSRPAGGRLSAQPRSDGGFLSGNDGEMHDDGGAAAEATRGL